MTAVSPSGNPSTLRGCRHAICTLVSAVAIAVLPSLFCAPEYNPFADPENARAVIIGGTLGDGDTLSLFTTYTLTLDMAVRELVTRATVHAPGNRLWPSSDSVIDASSFDAAPFSFEFSFSDTGWLNIVVSTERTNQEIVADTLSVYRQSPLRQAPVSAVLGDPVMLRTPPVGDRDVIYSWSFGGVTVVSSPVCSTVASIVPARLAARGALWVSDGVVSSPADSFSFAFTDTTPPSITCVNDGSVGRDTVYTSDTVLNFKVRIVDRLDQRVDSASVNGESFDRAESNVYYKLQVGMHRHPEGSPELLTVYARDHYHDGNETARTFYLVFSDTAVHTAPAEIIVLSPAKDSSATGAGRYAVFGAVVNHTLDSLDLTIALTLNGIVDPIQRRLTASSASWQWDVSLDSGENRITVTATDNLSSEVIDTVGRTLWYAPSLPDTTGPVIARVTADGLEASNYYTAQSTVAVGAEVYDDAGGIESLTVGTVALLPSTSQPRWYFGACPLTHDPAGNELVVRAVDSSGNLSTRTVIVFRNRLPVVEEWPAPAYVKAGAPYADTMSAFDPDGDALVFELAHGPAGLTVSGDGLIAWTPLPGDTGNHGVTVRVWDGYQPVLRTFSLFVYPATGMPPGTVAFATTIADFPRYLEAGRDTMRVRLSVSSGTGIAPFVYSASVLGKGTTLLRSGPDSVVLWAPALSDTGSLQLMVMVRDQFPHFDTLYPGVLVIPANRPCSLTVSFGSDTLVDGTLDLNAHQGPDTLVFRITDPDNPDVEAYGITIRQSRTQSFSRLDSATVDSLLIALDPRVLDGYDTVMVTVRDRGGTVDSLKVVVYYGMSPNAPQTPAPVNQARVTGPTVELRWEGSDPDGDAVWYDVYLGTSDTDVRLIGTTAQNSLVVNGLAGSAMYWWRVVAHDWKSETPGSLWTFETR